jgi:hypothetical protein
MSRLPTGSAQAKNAYIPPNVQRAMQQQVQQSTPANLQKYAGGQSYIPKHAEQAMTKQLEKTLPAHMQEYITPFMQQQVVAGQASMHAQPSPVTPHAPTPNLMRRDHSLGFGEQHTVAIEPTAPNEGVTSLAYTPQYQPEPQPQQSYPPQQTPPANPPHGDLSFIMDPAQPPKKPRKFSLGGSPFKKILVAVGGLILLLIISSLFSGRSHVSPQLVSAAQQQQALIHLTTNAANEPSMSDASKNFAITTKLSLTSSQRQLLSYMSRNHKKLNSKALNLKVSSSADKQLAAALSDGSYDRTFLLIMQQQLNAYQRQLSLARANTPGHNGRVLIANEQQSAKLLQQMLETK